MTGAPNALLPYPRPYVARPDPPNVRRRGLGARSNAFDRHTRIEIPTCFYFPDPDVQPFSGGTADDLARIRQSFKKPTPIVAVLRETRGFAHVEEPAEFLRVLKGFLTASGILE